MDRRADSVKGIGKLCLPHKALLEEEKKSQGKKGPAGNRVVAAAEFALGL